MPHAPHPATDRADPPGLTHNTPGHEHRWIPTGPMSTEYQKVNADAEGRKPPEPYEEVVLAPVACACGTIDKLAMHTGNFVHNPPKEETHDKR